MFKDFVIQNNLWLKTKTFFMELSDKIESQKILSKVKNYFLRLKARSNYSKIWFKTTSYGWGWYPITLQGWSIFISWIIIVAIITKIFNTFFVHSDIVYYFVFM